MRKTLNSYVSTLALILALFAAFSSYSYAQFGNPADACDGTNGQAIYGRVLANSYTGAGFVRVHARSLFGTVQSTVADVNGYYAFRLRQCTRWFIAPDSNHPSNDYGVSIDTDRQNSAVDSQAGDDSYMILPNFTFTNCDSNGLAYNRFAHGIVHDADLSGAPPANTGVAATSPRDGTYLAEARTDVNGAFSYNGNLGACSYYIIQPYLPPQKYAYMNPAYRVINTADIGVGTTLSGTAYPITSVRGQSGYVTSSEPTVNFIAYKW